MGRRVALVRFAGGAELYGVYCDTSDWMTRRELYDTPALAQEARDAAEAGAEAVRQVAAPREAAGRAEDVTIFPYWAHGDFKASLDSKASLRDRWLTGIRSHDERPRESGDAFGPRHADFDI